MGSKEESHQRNQLSPQQIRELFEQEVKRIGYHGPLEFNSQLGTYESTHDTAMFVGFRIGFGMKSGTVIEYIGAGINVGKSTFGVDES